MPSLYRTLALSDHPLVRALRSARRRVHALNVPAPKAIVRPLLWLVLAVREVYYFVARVFVVEPLTKAYCARVGRGFHGGVYLPWITGRGEIGVGNDVRFWGKVNVGFAARFVDRPRLVIGDHTSIGHDVSFSIGKEIRIGRWCHIAGSTRIFDSSGHPTNPAKRLAQLPPDIEDVKPVTIEDNVWIGQDCIVFPGVTIGEGSVVATGSVVTANVPPNTLVAGYPARMVRRLAPESDVPAPLSLREHTDRATLIEA